MKHRRILVTAALPYANGHIHMGHLVEYIQTDIWVRFQKMRGHDCIYLCADDTHGTAIMIRAKQEGRTEEALIADMREAHIRDFAKFDVAFDNYGSTHSPKNKQLCELIWRALRAKGLIEQREVTQLYDPVAGVFLADRFVKGTCPKCQAEDQYGDSCEKCGSTYTPGDLVNPRSTLSGAAPEVRSAEHLFVTIENLRPFLIEWTQSNQHLQEEIANYLKGHFLGEPLRDWDVSRPAPYFGFEIPDHLGHYWYVWFDAPIGYIASTWEYCDRTGQTWESWWKRPGVEIHHFIGKDITYFHTLFWPAMLRAAEFNLPERIHIHGFLTVNGEKMSKSRGTFVLASTYAEHLDASYLRYYFASKLGPRVDDLDLNLEEFVNKVNSDLVGKLVNLASRTARLIAEVGLSEAYPDDGGLFSTAAARSDEIADAYEQCDFARMTRIVMGLVDRANEYVDAAAPWTLRKDPAKQAALRDSCTIALNLYRQAVVYLAPVLPDLAKKTGELFGQPVTAWGQAQTPVLGIRLNPFQHLLQRADLAQAQKMLEASMPKEEVQEKAAKPEVSPSNKKAAHGNTAPVTVNNGEEKMTSDSVDGPECLAAEPLADVCTIDDFAKVDLRVGRIVSAEAVEGSDKLLKLSISLGGDVCRTVFAGVKSAYAPEALLNRLVVFVANLAPRKMRFGTSEGMLLAAGAGGSEIFILSPDSGAKPGQRVH